MYIRVFVTAGAHRTRLTSGKDGAIMITVREPAQGGLANEAVRSVIAREYGTSLEKVRLVSGHHSRTKVLALDN